MINDFQTLNFDSDLKGGEKRLHQRKQIAILHKNNVPARRIAWFSQSRLQLVNRWIIRIESDDVELHYIFDNYNTHYHDNFCKTVAKLSGVKYKPLKTGKERQSRSVGAEDKRVVIHFLPFHGSWLNMIEIWFGLLKNK